jgi:hypothetical protein
MAVAHDLHECSQQFEGVREKIDTGKFDPISRAIAESHECIFVDPAHFDVLLIMTIAHDGLMRFGWFFRWRVSGLS